jgi:hypothetical protein
MLDCCTSPVNDKENQLNAKYALTAEPQRTQRSGAATKTLGEAVTKRKILLTTMQEVARLLRRGGAENSRLGHDPNPRQEGKTVLQYEHSARVIPAVTRF